MQLRMDSFRMERWTIALFGFFAIVLIAKCSVLHFPNFIFTYPWISYDGYQWIADSLYYLNRHINITQRNPLLPITFAVLRTFDAVEIFPWILGLLTFLFYVSLYWLSRAFLKPNAARITIFWFFFVFRIHAFFDFILADPWAITTITFGLGSLVRVRANPRYLVGAAGFFGLSLNYQFAAGFMSPALIWFVLAGLGMEWCRSHLKIIAMAGLLFLALALPQFISKWIVFGSPLYSHVIHFPLIRFHLFGLPGYFVGFFAFLGWPLALLVAAGLKRATSQRSPEWQLIHLSATCMFVFWILCYLWLDIRFLLYLVPMWVVYAGYAIELFAFETLLSFAGKTPFQRLLIVGSVYFGLSLSAIKAGAFDGGGLALTPATTIRFSSSPLTEWSLPVLNFHNYTTEYSDADSSIWAVFKYQRYYRKSGYDEEQKLLGDETNELGKIVRERTNSTDKVGVRGELMNVFETKMRLFNTIERNLDTCDASTKYCVVKKTEIQLLDSSFTPIWSGQRLVLAERRS